MYERLFAKSTHVGQAYYTIHSHYLWMYYIPIILIHTHTYILPTTIIIHYVIYYIYCRQLKARAGDSEGVGEDLDNFYTFIGSRFALFKYIYIIYYTVALLEI